MSYLVVVLVALIGAGGAVWAAHIMVRLGRQDQALGTIQVNINGRLDRLLKERAELIEENASLKAEIENTNPEKGTP